MADDKEGLGVLNVGELTGSQGIAMGGSAGGKELDHSDVLTANIFSDVCQREDRGSDDNPVIREKGIVSLVSDDKPCYQGNSNDCSCSDNHCVL